MYITPLFVASCTSSSGFIFFLHHTIENMHMSQLMSISTHNTSCMKCLRYRNYTSSTSVPERAFSHRNFLDPAMIASITESGLFKVQFRLHSNRSSYYILSSRRPPSIMASNKSASLLNTHSHTCVPTRLTPLITGLPDKYPRFILSVLFYWACSLSLQFCDEYSYLSEYKLHTPAEFCKRNRVSVREVVREVLVQHAMQTLLGGLLAYGEPDELTGCKDQDVAIWA